MSLGESPFVDRLLRLNAWSAGGFLGWDLRPGMLFGAERTWWGGEAARPRAHEGLDLRGLINGQGRAVCLGEGTWIPPLADGQVVAVFADFVGQSLLLSHQMEASRQFYSLYAHVLAAPGLVPGGHCPQGEAIARVAQGRPTGAPAHLHLSTFWLVGGFTGALSWPRLQQLAAIRWCDPLAFIGPNCPALHPGAGIYSQSNRMNGG